MWDPLYRYYVTHTYNNYLDMYLHELLPVVISCVVSKQLCQGAKENHWALRTYASRVLSLISRNFTTTTTMLQYRIVKSLSKPLENQDAAFPQIYGSIVGLAELGSEVIRRTILPKLRRISEKIEAVQVRRNIFNKDVKYIFNITGRHKKIINRPTAC